MCRRLPSVLKQTARRAWSIDRRAVLLLVCCQLAIGVRADLQLASLETPQEKWLMIFFTSPTQG
ncbi:hypothetical protein SM007_33495 [Streptomyces avermitilis]|nr:hypothetical protein [Streptomyces avermitilis]OOV21700.1 hypothetical protein SM007_33495 [Streptomyces avermitilis]